MRLSGARARPMAFACVAALAGAVVLAGSSPIRLIGVSARSDDNGQTVLIEATEPVAYAVSRPDPLTVLVDLRSASIDDAVTRVSETPAGPVRSVRVEEAKAADGEAIARVRLGLSEPAPHRVRSTRNTIRVEFLAAGAVSAPAADPMTAIGPAAAARPAASVASELVGVRTAVEGERVRVTLSGNGRLEPARVFMAEDRPMRLVLDFADVRPIAPGETAGAGDLIGRVRVGLNSRDPLVTRVVIDLNRDAAYHVERAGLDGKDVSVMFEKSVPAAVTPVAAPAEPAATPAPATLSEAAPPVAIDPMSALTKAPAPTVAPPASRGAAAPARQSQTPPAAPAPVSQTPGSQRYTGHLITLDFQDADLRAVLRTFAEISGLNMVIDPSVQGTVNVVLTDVPWDQALDIILRGSKLGYSVDGTVVRIAPLSVLSEEEGARRKLSEEQALAGSLSVMTKALSYAKAASLAPLVTRSALSARGEIQVDERTNTLIIRDLPANLTTAEQLIGDLDRPEPQVEIEARIVQTNRDFARALGVQWGLTGRMAPDLGNTTGLAFPNRGVLDGRTGASQGPADPRAGTLDRTGSAVSLPVAGASSAIGLMLSSINGSFNLDVALSALERSGKGRILSTPRVTTQNNQEAEMTQGVQIPIQTVANNTVTVSFKDAALTLKVTPQITAANTVIMRIQLENASPDFSKSINNIPPINTQRAITQVQVTDGATTVIGGIFTSTQQSTSDRTPILNKIPLLGWLFRRDSSTDASTELLIFITPRIIRG